MSFSTVLKYIWPSSKFVPPQSWGMILCNVSVASIAIISGFYLSVAVHELNITEQVPLCTVVALISLFFLVDAFKHLAYEAMSSRLPESREFFSKLKGFSFKKANYSQEQIDKNIHRVSISIAHFQGLMLFFIMFAFLSHRLNMRFTSETSMAASFLCASFLPWIAVGQ